VSATPVSPADGADQLPRWGLGDVAVGFFLAYLSSAVVGVVVLGVLGYTRQSQVPLWLEYVLEIPLWTFFIGVPIVVTRQKGGGVVHDLGLRMRAVDVPIGIGAGLVGQLVLIPLVYWPLFKLLGHSENVSQAARQLTDKVHGPADGIVLVLLVAVGAPFAEELFFRGLTQRAFLKLRRDEGAALWRLVARGAPWAAILLTDLFWAVIHGEPLQFLGLFAFGVVLGVLAWRTGRLGPSIWAHVTFNALAAATLVWKLHTGN